MEKTVRKTTEGKKHISMLLVLRALESAGDKEHPVKQGTLAGMVGVLGEKIGADIWCDRKTVGRHIKLLNSVGYRIRYVRGRGYYMESNKLSNDEFGRLKSLIRASSWSEEEKERMIEKLLANQQYADETMLGHAFSK